MTIEGIDSPAGNASVPEVAAAAAPSRISSSKTSPGQGFGQDSYFLSPERTEAGQEQQARRARDGFNAWAAALGFAFLVSMLTAVLICVIWSAAPGYSPMRFSSDYFQSATQPPQQSDFSARANCTDEPSNRRCR